MKTIYNGITLLILLLCLSTMSVGQTYSTNDISALTDFLASTGGGSLTAPTGWNAALPANQRWVSSNPYDQWYGVHWTNATTRRVDSLNLKDLGYGTSITGGVGLIGGLPDSFITLTGKMSGLAKLDVSGNRLNDPPSLLGTWTHGTSSPLSYVDFGDNRFSSISGDQLFVRTLTGALNLQELYAENYLSGGAITAGLFFPTFPTNLVTLERLDMSNNGLRGSVSTLLASILNIKWLDLSNNRVNAIPTVINTTTEFIDVSFNELDSSHHLNEILENYYLLEALHARNAMNTTLGQSHVISSPLNTFSTVLGYVDLSLNNLTGALDLNDPVFNIAAIINLNSNLLSQITFPSSNNTTLVQLDIGNNNFNQPIDIALFERLPKIEELQIGNNDFYGTLPTPTNSNYNLPSLKALGLENCGIEGALRLDWILSAQNQVSGVRNTTLKELKISDNNFSEVVLHSNAPNMPYDSLARLYVDGNKFDFVDLYEFVKAFRMPHVGNGYGFLNPIASAGEFIYGNQDTVGIGGVRRRRPGRTVTFQPKPDFPISYTSQDTLYSRITWRRKKLSNSVDEGIVEFKLDSNRILSGAINNVLFTNTMSGGSLNLLPNFRRFKFGSLQLRNVDTTHNDWTYRALITHDSFPNLILLQKPIKFVMGNCYDSLGNIIRCQEILVRYNPDSVSTWGANSELFKQQVRREQGAKKVEECDCGDLELWELYDTTNQVDVEAFGFGTRSSSTQADSRTELLSAEPNYYVEADSFPVPQIPPSFSQGTTHPTPTLVAIIDSGTDYDHPEVRNRMWVNLEDTSQNDMDDDGDCIPDNGLGYSFVDDNNIPYDAHGHGTAVAGIVGGYSQYNIAQNTSNYDSLAIIPLKMTDTEGNGSLYHAACAIYHANQYKDVVNNSPDSLGVRVINASWGYYGEPSPSLYDAISFSAQNCGMLFVTSAGNDGIDNDTASHYPSDFDLDNIITVASANATGTELMSYSNFGSQQVDIAARGDDYTTKAGGSGANEEYVFGTSFSAAQLSRAAGLLFHEYPNASYFAVKEALLRSATPLNSVDSTLLSSGGMLNLAAARNVMANILNVDECSNNIIVSTENYEYTEQGMRVRVFPNPVHSSLIIHLDNDQAENVKVRLVNLSGQQLYEQTISQERSHFQLNIPMGNMAAGMYLLEISSSAENFVKKIIKTR